jgi:mycothiol synthase
MINKRSYSIRNYFRDDFDKYFQLQVESEKLEPAGRFISAESLSDYLGRPNFTPQKDLFVAELNENLVGWLSLTLEPGIGRALLDGLVHPLHRCKGIASQLIASALQRVRDSGIMSAQASISETNAPARGFLHRQGFAFIRYFFEMRLNIANTRFPANRQGSTTHRRLKNGEEVLLTELQNRCFGDSWGFNPNTAEEIAYRLNMRGRAPGDVTLTFLENKPVGYCWTIIDADANAERKKNKGLIHMMGVDPDFRQQEIGKAILLNGLRDLKDRGVDTVELTVDSENLAACSLYESVGFAVYAKTEWYEKIVD